MGRGAWLQNGGRSGASVLQDWISCVPRGERVYSASEFHGGGGHTQHIVITRGCSHSGSLETTSANRKRGQAVNPHCPPPSALPGVPCQGSTLQRFHDRAKQRHQPGNQDSNTRSHGAGSISHSDHSRSFSFILLWMDSLVCYCCCWLFYGARDGSQGFLNPKQGSTD